MTPYVSVIIPILDDYVRLRECLEALDGQTYPSDHFEVLVVDNGTPAPRRASPPVGDLTLDYLVEPRGGSYAARNHGINHATGELVAFTDSDCVPAADWLERGVDAVLRSPEIGLVAGRIDVFAKDADAPTAVELYELVEGFPQEWYATEKHFGATANVFTRSDVLEDVGRFNGSMHSAGDKEWGQRVARGGYQVVYAEDVVVRHPARRTASELQQKMSRVANGLHDLDFASANPLGKQVFAAAKIARNTLPPLRFMLRTMLEPDRPAFRKAQLIAVHLFYVYGMGYHRIRLLLSDLLGRS